MSKIWNSNMSKKTRVIFVTIGLVIILISSIAFFYTYRPNLDLDGYMGLSICSVFFALGLELNILVFNIENKYIRSMLLVCLGGIIVAIYYNEYIRTGSVLLLFSIMIFIIIAFIKNIFSTLVTFTVLSIPFLICLEILLKKYPLYGNAIFYLILVMFFIFYRMIGVKANKFFIGRCMGFNNEAQRYDLMQLKEQINFIYVFVFILMNIENWFFNNNITVATILNNAFVTGVAITNINWGRIFWFAKAK